MASVAFRIAGIEPKHDPDWGRAPAAMRRDFWRAVVKLGLAAKDRELAAGKDRHGAAMTPIAASTRANRRSAMGHPDPNAPPLTPAYGLSRTRSLLDGRAHADHALFFWRYDPHTQGHWGKILGYHRAGKGRLPVRDVIGLSPASLAWVKAQSWQAWGRIKRGVSATVATNELSVRVTPPPRAPKRAPAKIAVIGRTDLENATFGIGGTREQVASALARGQFTGFRQFHPPTKPSPPAKPRPIAPRPAPTPALPVAARPARPAAVAQPVVPGAAKPARVQFVPSEAAAYHGDVTVHADVGKVDAALARDRLDYVGPGGTGAAIEGRYPGFEGFLATGAAVEMPRVALGADEGVVVRNGRHRFAVLRDRGHRVVPVSVAREDAKRFRQLYGAR